MPLDRCAFGVTENQNPGIVDLENLTPEPVMYFFYDFVVFFCTICLTM